jgi:hypothetical protein
VANKTTSPWSLLRSAALERAIQADMTPEPPEPRKAHMKRKRTPAEKRAARERKKKFMTIFINGKQKWVPRPPTIDGLPVEEFIARNADPIWLHENGLWEFMTPDAET